MQLKNITPKDPFSLILSNQQHNLNKKDISDNTWEIQYDGGELGGISLYSTLALRALSVRITPIFTNPSENKLSLKSFYKEPVIAELLPDYVQISAEIFPEINYQLEYFVFSSESIYGQVIISNQSKVDFLGDLQYIVSLKPLTIGEQMKGVISDDSIFYLSGKTSNLFPVFFLSGKVEPGKQGQSSILSHFKIKPGEDHKLNWCFIFCDEELKTQKFIDPFQKFNFEKEVIRNLLEYKKDYIHFETGNHEWDLALQHSQKSAQQLFIKNTNDIVNFSQSRHPEKSIFLYKGPDHSAIEGISPLQLWYFSQVLPFQKEKIKQGLLQFLEYQNEKGFIPNHENPANYLAKFHAFPILATITKEILEEFDESVIVFTIFPKLISYLHYWLTDLVENETPRWDNALQSLYEDLPIQNSWDPGSDGIHSRWIASPFLLSLLIKELENCLFINDQLNIDTSEIDWIQYGISSLNKLLNEQWDSKKKYFSYRDVKTKTSTRKIKVLRTPKIGLINVEKKFPFPQRLSIRIYTTPEVSKNVLIEITGLQNGQPMHEKIQTKDFHWNPTSGITTSTNNYDEILSVNVINLHNDAKLEISTCNLNQIDLTNFIPIIVNKINPSKINQMIDHWIHNHLLGKFGLRLIPKNDLSNEGKLTNVVDLPLNTMILIGLIEKKYFGLAENIYTNLLKVVIKNLRTRKNFYKLYDAETGTCTGEYNIINGMIPVKVFMRLLGIQRWNDSEIVFSGPSVFKEEVKVYYRGMSIICTQKGHTIITSDGKNIDLISKDNQPVKIPTSNRKDQL